MFLPPETTSLKRDVGELESFELLRTFGERLLSNIGFTNSQIVNLQCLASRHGTQFHDELVKSTVFNEGTYYREMASLLSVPFVANIDPERIIIKERSIAPVLKARFGANIVLYQEREGRSSILVAPSHMQLHEFVVHLCRYPSLRARIRIVSQSELRRALIHCGSSRFLHQATSFLASEMPGFSARIVSNAWQGAMFGALLIALPGFYLLYPLYTAVITHIFFSVFFLACVHLRSSAAAFKRRTRYRQLKLPDWRKAPRYTILIPLYHENTVVPDLLSALSRLEWPRSKLEVKLVCEADDKETQDAISNQFVPKWVEVIAVPASQPRTKPKALNYALQVSTGDIVCVYDAEDRPHPKQLIEAWQQFSTSGSDLACLQAPLVIGNFAENSLTRLFAFEYAALFRGILPWLSRNGRIFPLGGTSNHFRRAALEDIGGWDPYNVTEDADIGIRLLRHGYRMSTITRPTIEDAPANFEDWLKQRTRWYKGWIQTWLVHNRSPLALYREIGAESFVFGQILFSGMIVSALVHPAFVFMIADLFVQYLSGVHMGGLRLTLAIVDTSNIVLAYSAFLLLGYRTLIAYEKPGFFRLAARTPLYWLAISLAAWRAVYQLVANPFLWEKTPHKRHFRPLRRRL